MVDSYWRASSRRRRFILQRYGRGPKKKPPERVKPINNHDNTSKILRSPVNVDPQRLFRERNYYRTCRCTVFHNKLPSRLPSLILAGSRRSYRSISHNYYNHSRRYLIHSGPVSPTSATTKSDSTIQSSPSYSPLYDIISALVAVWGSSLHKAWRLSSMLLWPPCLNDLTSFLTSSHSFCWAFTPANTSLIDKVSSFHGSIFTFLVKEGRLTYFYLTFNTTNHLKI